MKAMMKNIAPDIMRQRLLIEGFFTKNVTRDILIPILKTSEHTSR